MKRLINKVAVIGSGIMGSRIACQLANVGKQVLLLDIAPANLSEAEQKAGLTPDHPKVKNRIVNDALQAAIKSNPSPIYHQDVVRLIETGNLTDDLPKIASCDWIIEVVVERLDIKKQLFEKVEKFRKPGTLITSNTSGIPIHLMAQGRSDDFKKNFCGTHFFNPPRYLKLLEIIPTEETSPEVIDFLMEFGRSIVGKNTVLCKDTPAFIANRVGVFSIMALFHLVEESGLTVDEVDKLTGPVLGRPKSATFRTCDVVGLDTLIHVANGLKANCPADEAKHLFELPAFIQKMSDNKWLGDKTGQGFYKKTKDEKGKTQILSLDLKTLEYKASEKVKFPVMETTKTIDKLSERFPILLFSKDKAGEFYRKAFYGLFNYVAHRIPEISDELYRIDEAMKAGFGWELGPFEYWDAAGVQKVSDEMKASGHQLADWVNEFLSAGHSAFYKFENGVKFYYDIPSKSYKKVPGSDKQIVLNYLRNEKVIWKNAGTSIFDLGDGVLNLEFHTKMNSVGTEVLQGIQKVIDMAEKDYKAVVIANDGANFSAGANLAMVFMMAVEQEWDEIDFSIRAFQNTVTRIRFSSIPVVVAPKGLALGGGCEMVLHADAVVASAESYIGLVEFGVGVIPGGGGTKEFVLRASDEYEEGEILLPTLRKRFLTIGQAKVSTSAHEAFDLGILQKHKDMVIVHQDSLIAEAKKKALALADAGYSKPVPRKNIKVLGRSGLGMIYAGANSMYSGQYISEHDKKISEKLGYVMCGGDLSAPTEVSEQYLLDLEREAFLSLCGEKKTLERIQSILTTGKILRN